MKSRPFVLSIAGFDPSNGAGLTADVKTFEALKVYGLSVCTSNTIQNDIDFVFSHWVDFDVIKAQLEVLFKRFKVEFVKIGIVQNWEMLNIIIDMVLDQNRDIKIVVDPVLKSSSGFSFHNASIASWMKTEKQFEEILNKIYLLTPNYREIEHLFPDKNVDETIQAIRSKTNLLLKGGHRKNEVGKDELYTKDGKYYALQPKRKDISEKHGSGCVLSSAILAHLALGFSLHKACFKGKRYVEKVLSSNKNLLGYHRI